MRLAFSYGPQHAVNRSLCHLLRKPSVVQSSIQHRSVNTKARHERPQPIIEQISLRPQPNSRAQSIGILGGGITGLTTAWHLSRFVPDAKITIYEKGERIGGWLDSEIVDVDGGEVLFEWGPRSLRPDPAGSGRATILLLLQLKLQEAIIGVTKTSPAALNRFIYYDNKLVQMPGPNPNLPPFLNAIRNGYKVLTEPIFKGLLGSIFAEFWVKPRPVNMTDESVGDFIRRRFGPTAANNIASAFFHGIYAGDLYKLSARTLLPALWHMECRDPEGAGVLMEMTDIAFKGQGLMQYKHGRYVDLLEAAEDHDNSATTAFIQQMHHDLSVYTFGRGLQQMGQRLREKLEEKPNVEIKKLHDVQDLKFEPQSKKIAAHVGSKQQWYDHDYVVSTLGAGKLRDFVKGSVAARGGTLGTSLNHALEESDRSVRVGVVNLYYSNPDLIPTNLRGFGYLIPRSVNLDQNPERGLGVIFGSETSGVRGKEAVQTVKNPSKESLRAMDEFLQATTDQAKNLDEKGRKNHAEMLERLRSEQKKVADQPDEITIRAGQDTAPGTKLTVMLGGHWWDGWENSDLPREQELIEMAQTLLARHLKIMEAPMVARARMNRDCIPQYTVGYRQRMATIHQGLMDEFQGRLKLAGPWWVGGVGVNDCVMSGHMTAFNIREEWDDETGLKEYTEKEKWLICDRRTQTFTIDPAK